MFYCCVTPKSARKVLRSSMTTSTLYDWDRSVSYRGDALGYRAAISGSNA